MTELFLLKLGGKCGIVYMNLVIFFLKRRKEMTSRRKQKNGQNKIIIAILSLLIVAAVAVCTVTVTELAGHFSAPDTQP